MKLKDPYNRPVSNLRVSVTPECNLSCIYCHREGEKAPHGAAQYQGNWRCPVNRCKIRHQKCKIHGWGAIIDGKTLSISYRLVPDSMESSITTNGILLADYAAELKEAGMSRVNISLDSLNPETYKKITGSDRLSDVLSGIDAALEAGLTPIKLNMVMLRGINDHELEDFYGYIRNNRNLILQLIELMSLGGCECHSDLSALEEDLAGRSKVILTRRMHHRKKYCLDGAES